jgi:hypothetical protein
MSERMDEPGGMMGGRTWWGRILLSQILDMRRVLFQKVKGHFFLHDRHTIFYVYYKRYKFDSMVLLSASIRRPSYVF